MLTVEIEQALGERPTDRGEIAKGAGHPHLLAGGVRLADRKPERRRQMRFRLACRIPRLPRDIEQVVLYLGETRTQRLGQPTREQQAERWNDLCNPFVWTKTADQILRKANRQTTSNAGH